MTDIGIRNAILNVTNLNRGKILENIIYNELINRDYEVYIGKSRYIPEIDFIAKKNNQTLYIQVCEYFTDDNMRREKGNLLKIKDSNKKIILSLDNINKIDNDGIEYKNIIKFLLED